MNDKIENKRGADEACLGVGEEVSDSCLLRPPQREKHFTQFPLEWKKQNV